MTDAPEATCKQCGTVFRVTAGTVTRSTTRHAAHFRCPECQAWIGMLTQRIEPMEITVYPPGGVPYILGERVA